MQNTTLNIKDSALKIQHNLSRFGKSPSDFVPEFLSTGEPIDALSFSRFIERKDSDFICWPLSDTKRAV